MAVISGIVVRSVVFSLLLGWFFVRHALSPPTGGRLSPSGARPWSRFRVPNPTSLIPNNHAGSAPASGSAFWAYAVAGGYPTNTVVNNVPGGFSTGYRPSQQLGAPVVAHMAAPGNAGAPPVQPD